MRTRRDNHSLLSKAEQSVIRGILPHIPATVTPDHLTYLGLFGSVITGASLALCAVSAAFLTLAILGLFLNWVGDSFDGSLARHRSIERPRYGFMMDHSIDLISTVLILIGLGVSPYLPFDSACFALITYLLFCAFVYIKIATHGVHKLDFAGLGATEFRILVAGWVLVIHGFQLEPVVNYTIGSDGYLGAIPVMDMAVGALCCVACVGLVRTILADTMELKAVEPAPAGAAVVEFFKRAG